MIYVIKLYQVLSPINIDDDDVNDDDDEMMIFNILKTIFIHNKLLSTYSSCFSS